MHERACTFSNYTPTFMEAIEHTMNIWEKCTWQAQGPHLKAYCGCIVAIWWGKSSAGTKPGGGHAMHPSGGGVMFHS